MSRMKASVNICFPRGPGAGGVFPPQAWEERSCLCGDLPGAGAGGNGDNTTAPLSPHAGCRDQIPGAQESCLSLSWPSHGSNESLNHCYSLPWLSEQRQQKAPLGSLWITDCSTHPLTGGCSKASEKYSCLFSKLLIQLTELTNIPESNHISAMLSENHVPPHSLNPLLSYGQFKLVLVAINLCAFFTTFPLLNA